MADGYLTFDTKLNTAGFKSGLGAVTGMFSKLALLAGVAFSATAVIAFGKAAVKAAGEAEAKFKGLDFLMRANGRSMQRATSFIQEFTADGLVPMTSAYESYKNMVSRGYSTDQIEKMLKVMKDAAVYNRQGQFSMGEAMEKATLGLRMENSLLTDSVGIQKNVAKMWDEYAKSIGTTANNLTMVQKRQAEFNGFMKEGGVFAGAAAEYANSYAGRIATIGAAFKNLQIAVGNAVIPFINALLPAITRAILWFTKLFNIIGMVVNLLFGTNVGMADAEAAIAGSAEATAVATGEVADNTKKAGEAAKGALASFDKLNVLSQTTAEGSGGSAGGGGGLLPPIDPVADGGLMKGLDDLQVKVKEFIDDYKNDVKDIGWFNATMQKIYELLTPVRDWVQRNVMDPIQNAFGVAWEWIKQAAADAWSWVVGAWNGAGAWFKDKVTSPISKVFSSAWSVIGIKVANVWNAIKTAWQGAANWFNTTIWTPITTRVSQVWSGIRAAATNIGVSIGNLIISAINSAIGIINGILAGVQNAANKVIDFIDIFNSGKQYITIGSIPTIPTGPTMEDVLWGYGATGAVIPPNAPFPVIYGDQRSGRNLETPEKLMRQIVREETAGMGGVGGKIIFDVDEVGLMRYLHPKFTAETRRVGPSMAKAAGAA